MTGGFKYAWKDCWNDGLSVLDDDSLVVPPEEASTGTEQDCRPLDSFWFFPVRLLQHLSGRKRNRRLEEEVPN